MKYWMLFMSMILASCLDAQELVFTPIANSLCKPGVEGRSPGKGLSLEYLGRGNLSFGQSNSGDESTLGVVDRLRAKVKIPIIHKEHLTILIGADYMNEEYEFKDIDQQRFTVFNSINDKLLKTSRLSAYVIKPFNDRMYGTIKVETSFNGDFGGVIDFSKRYRIFRAAAVIGVKKREDLEWGVGLMFSKGFRNTRVYPFAIYNQTFNEKWGIEAILPAKIHIRRNLKPGSMLLAGAEFKSRVYSIDVDEGDEGINIFHMRNAEIQGGITYKQRLHSWVWFDVTAGFVKTFTNSFDRVEPMTQLDFLTARQSSGPFVGMSIFLSPPKEKCK